MDRLDWLIPTLIIAILVALIMFFIITIANHCDSECRWENYTECVQEYPEEDNACAMSHLSQ